MEPLFLAGHPALDFLNTAFTPGGHTVDVIADGEALARWLVAAGLLTREQMKSVRRKIGAAGLDKAAGEARALRAWATPWIDRWRRHPHADHSSELARLNRLLQRTRSWPQLDATFALREEVRLDDARDLVVLLARSVAALLASEDPRLVKRCAGHDCSLRFVDRTRAHSRVFCSAQSCGNRAKVEAFRERQRAKAT
jgi:predicted RNA-binding Zn ribbon-like protein